MIGNVFAGYGIDVKTTNHTPYINISSHSSAMEDQHGRKYADGEIRCRDYRIEVYVNGVWNELPGNTVSIAISYELNEVVSWVRQQQEKERKLNELIKEHPALRDAKHNLDAMIALLSDYKENNP